MTKEKKTKLIVNSAIFVVIAVNFLSVCVMAWQSEKITYQRKIIIQQETLIKHLTREKVESSGQKTNGEVRI